MLNISSRVLYDTRNNKIIYSQAKPLGSAPVPPHETVCQSARVPDDELEYMSSIVIDENYISFQAKKRLRIINDQVFEKPKCEISLSSNRLAAGSILTVDVEITNTIESDSFSEVNMQINGVDFVIDITNNQGSKNIELTEIDNYKIICNDERFISQPAEVEVI